MLLHPSHGAVPPECHRTLVTKEEITSRDYKAGSGGHKQPNFPQRQAVYDFVVQSHLQGTGYLQIKGD